MALELIIIVVLLMFSALFSASETAILTVSKSKVHKLKSNGNKKAAILSKLKEDKEVLIGAILLGNNFVNTAASSIATGICITLVGSGGDALLIATFIMTFVILIVSEIMPKTYAVRHSEFVAIMVAPLMNVITYILKPVLFSISIIVNKILILFEKNIHSTHISALENIKTTIDIYHQEGEVISDYKYMLSGVIELAELVVKEVMVHRNECFRINIDLQAHEIISIAISSPYSRIPLWSGDSDNIVAVLHIKDLTKLLLDKKELKKVTKSDILSVLREPWFIPSTTNLNAQLIAFKDRHQHFALTVNEYGELEGIVTLEDILEEVVGHIEDEYDINKNIEIKVYPDGAIIAGGNVSIRDLNRAMQWSISDAHAHTVGGLLFHMAQGIPDISQTFICENFKIKLIKKSKNKILKVKIDPINHQLDMMKDE